jgi:thymidylate synthase (FAD)
MILAKPGYKIIAGSTNPIKQIEDAARTYYKSESDGKSKAFVRRLINMGHESTIEHTSLTVRFWIDRGVSHELVRHCLASFSRESIRYVDYDGGCEFIIPPWVDLEPGEYEYNKSLTKICGPGYAIPFVTLNPSADGNWLRSMITTAASYKTLRENGWSPQKARSVLPNAIKTEIAVTANAHEWRHILKLHTAKAAHPQMREVMIPLLKELQENIPVLFDDIEPAKNT